MRRGDEDALRAWQLLMRFFFAQREHLPAWGEPFGLSPVQCHLLHFIEPDEPVPMNRLAGVLQCDASNVTGLVDRLEQLGIVERRPSPTDRRVKVVRLTPTGARLRTQMLRRMVARPLPLSRLGAREHRTLVKLLQRLLDDEGSS